MDAWIGAVKAKTLQQVAPGLGLTLGRLSSFGPCPACKADRRGGEDRRGPLGTRDRVGWKCHKCGEHGDVVDLIALVRMGRRTEGFGGGEWAELRAYCAAQGWCIEAEDRPPTRSAASMTSKLLGNRDARQAPQQADAPRTGSDQGRVSATPHEAESGAATGGRFAWSETLAEECRERLWEPEGEPVLRYLRASGADGGRGFTEDTILEWGLGACIVDGEPWLTIPLRDYSERVVNVRFRSVPPAKKTFRVCAGRPLPLFGADRLGTDLAGPVIVTEGELDVVALWQYGFNVSVVSGTGGADTWLDEWLDLLEPYAGFVVAYDNDEAGERGAAKFAEKMGLDRCARAVLPRKDAGDCLAQGVAEDQIRRAIVLARPMFGVSFRSAGDYIDELERLITTPEELVGRSTGSRRLDECLGGLRPGVVVVSGDTGHGKTTFATWVCWEQARAGVPVMITSFEQRPIGSFQKLLRMQLGGDFMRATPEDRRAGAVDLGALPLHFLDHYGNLPAEKMMNAIRYAARRLGVRVVLVDHLGFLLEPGEDERQQIEAIVRALAITAYTLGVTILLVCHPKALAPDADRPTLNDLKGASAIKQDASEVLIIVRDPPRPAAKPPRVWPGTWVYVDKVRSEYGSADSKALLAFGPLSCCYGDSWLDVPEGKTGVLVVVPETR